ncbi:MAG: hypothetical protein ACI9A1_001715 [Lentimonas sp.]|jgi:hypothetical protein
MVFAPPTQRTFRLSLCMALSLAFAYGIAFPLPYLPPIFALMLTLPPRAPLGVKKILAVLLLVALTTGCGILLIPMLNQYSMTGLILIVLGLFLCNFLAVNLGKGLVAALLTVGLTLVTAAGYSSTALAQLVVQSLMGSIAIAWACQHVAYFLFPEPVAGPSVAKKKAVPKPSDSQSNWLAWRATLIVFPAYLLALTNPGQYLPIIMKSVSLGQQDSVTDASHAARELLGSTFLAGLFAILFWFGLGIMVNLWMFFLWMLLFSLYFASKLYQISPSRYPASFWVNAAVTMLILLGPAVQDSANGNNVYMAFLVRISLFIAVTLYAIFAIYALERLRAWRGRKAPAKGT